MRGEQLYVFAFGLQIHGSPPLARGTGKGQLYMSRIFRITPACAGNSAPLLCRRGEGRDHPRLRGEQRRKEHRYRRRKGSPPLARGTEPYEEAKNGTPGITPACAGNRASTYNAVSARRDHPRLRGEQKNTIEAHSAKLGSPPLARGTAYMQLYLQQYHRITPACAGNRKGTNYIDVQRGDHPRLRGEQSPSKVFEGIGEGSPPLARGTAFVIFISFRLCGITPACAGNSRPRRSRPVPS